MKKRGFGPNFIYAGLGKSGSTLLYQTMKRNPNVCVSHPKGVHFWSRHWTKGPDWYFDHFKDYQGEPVVFEWGGYMVNRRALERIKACIGRDVTLVFSCRNPVDFFFSRYLHNVRMGVENRSFREALDDSGFRHHFDHLVANLEYSSRHFRELITLIFEEDILTGNFETRICESGNLPTNVLYAPSVLSDHQNKGMLPRYLWSGNSALELEEDGKLYVIPKRTLVFCSNNRYRRVYTDPDPSFVRKCIDCQQQWSTQLSSDDADYAYQEIASFTKDFKSFLGRDIPAWNIPSCLEATYSFAPIPTCFATS